LPVLIPGLAPPGILLQEIIKVSPPLAKDLVYDINALCTCPQQELELERTDKSYPHQHIDLEDVQARVEAAANFWTNRPV
jgi:hypothetical protein